MIHGRDRETVLGEVDALAANSGDVPAFVQLVASVSCHVCDTGSGHKGLPCPAFAHDLDRIVICKVLHASHDGKFLGRQWFTHQARKLRCRKIVRRMQRRIGINDSSAKLATVHAEI